ncbi:DUF302 domain-containing protein [Tissierella carlieri]|jgi:uncharacterized protein (DUF302 family)|uniref:DUF302 domain-containing protein n=1 Tax=Tissierella carlieri TaxID=689904 RepID=A0ABT1SGI7_9FIRM|nr:DUF302 domain-containing protein [Tissierella carlieri]MCQ4925611.1 DUF302 domain-containing protein [Tissierella carlieri]MDU5081700.1 DUF302 domain-containing protein [Bacillota bacterium]
MELRYEKVTNKSFDEAIRSITESLKEKKFGVLWQLNFKDKMNEHGIDFPNNFMILEVCNPHKANEVLTKHIEMGYFLPCKMVVYEKDGTVRIGTARPEILMGMAGYDDLGDVAREVEKILIEAINNAI